MFSLKEQDLNELSVTVGQTVAQATGVSLSRQRLANMLRAGLRRAGVDINGRLQKAVTPRPLTLYDLRYAVESLSRDDLCEVIIQIMHLMVGPEEGFDELDYGKECRSGADFFGHVGEVLDMKGLGEEAIRERVKA